MHQRKLTDLACKGIIRMVASKNKIDAKLIAIRLLNEEDKEDMRSGEISFEILNAHVCVWIKNGMPNYREGRAKSLAQEELEKNANKEVRMKNN